MDIVTRISKWAGVFGRRAVERDILRGDRTRTAFSSKQNAARGRWNAREASWTVQRRGPPRRTHDERFAADASGRAVVACCRIQRAVERPGYDRGQNLLYAARRLDGGERDSRLRGALHLRRAPRALDAAAECSGRLVPVQRCSPSHLSQ